MDLARELAAWKARYVGINYILEDGGDDELRREFLTMVLPKLVREEWNEFLLRKDFPAITLITDDWEYTETNVRRGVRL